MSLTQAAFTRTRFNNTLVMLISCLTCLSSWKCFVVSPLSATSSAHCPHSNIVYRMWVKTTKTGYILVVYDLQLHFVTVLQFVFHVIRGHKTLLTCCPHDQHWMAVHLFYVDFTGVFRNHCTENHTEVIVRWGKMWLIPGFNAQSVATLSPSHKKMILL